MRDPLDQFLALRDTRIEFSFLENAINFQRRKHRHNLIKTYDQIQVLAQQ